MSLLQQKSLVQKNKTICLPHIMVSIETIINKQTYQKKSIFQEKRLLAKISRSTISD